MTVALLAEGVDRNTQVWPAHLLALVALLAEGVDRNISNRVRLRVRPCVALLAEGVDRNRHENVVLMGTFRSPSSRRAWIEMKKQPEH